MNRPDILQRLEACRYVRNVAAQSCLRTFQYALHSPRKVSEVQFRNRWYKDLARVKNINASGWYDPPEYGMGVLFGTEEDFDRVNYSNLRQKEYWPRTNSFLVKNGTGYVFASPFALIEDVPIIGDFGITFYLGKNDVIRNHFRKCYRIISQLVGDITVGVAFQEFYTHVLTTLQNNGLKNNIISTTDSAGTNVGHTIPFTSDNPPTDMGNALLNVHEDKIHLLINKARHFINADEYYMINRNCAFTFEPRLVPMDGSKVPMVSFHTIIQIIEGKKVALGNFEGIINELGMQWIYN